MRLTGVFVMLPILSFASASAPAAQSRSEVEKIMNRLRLDQELENALSDGQLETAKTLLGQGVPLSITAVNALLSGKSHRLAEYKRPGDKPPYGGPSFDEATVLDFLTRVTLNLNQQQAANVIVSVSSEPSAMLVRRDIGWTPLGLAVYGSLSSTIVRRLLALGADPNIAMVTSSAEATSGINAKRINQGLRDGNRVTVRFAEIQAPVTRTPLMLAAENGLTELVRAMLESSGNPCKPVDVFGGSPVTALDLAKRRGHDEVVSLMQATGCK